VHFSSNFKKKKFLHSKHSEQKSCKGSHGRVIEWSLRAFPSMRAVINFVMRAANTLQIADGEQQALRKFSACWSLSLLLRRFLRQVNWLTPPKQDISRKARQHVNKQLLDEVFVISTIIKAEVGVICRILGLRLITLTKTLIILDITKTESNNCFFIH